MKHLPIFQQLVCSVYNTYIAIDATERIKKQKAQEIVFNIFFEKYYPKVSQQYKMNLLKGTRELPRKGFFDKISKKEINEYLNGVCTKLSEKFDTEDKLTQLIQAFKKTIKEYGYLALSNEQLDKFNKTTNSLDYIKEALFYTLLAVINNEELYIELTDSIITENVEFVDRKDDLFYLQEVLHKNKNVIISGQPGIGKSEIARQYAYENENTYKLVLFCNYSQNIKTTLINCISNLDTLTARFENDIIYNQLVKKIREYPNKKTISSNPEDRDEQRSLVILDGINNNLPSQEEMDELSHELNCHLIITTRCLAENSFLIEGLSHRGIVSLINRIVQRKEHRQLIINRNDTRSGYWNTMALALFLRLLDKNEINIDTLLSGHTAYYQAVQSIKIDFKKIGNKNKHSTIHRIYCDLFSTNYLNEEQQHFLSFLSMLYPYNVIPIELINLLFPDFTDDTIDQYYKLGWIFVDWNSRQISLIQGAQYYIKENSSLWIEDYPEQIEHIHQHFSEHIANNQEYLNVLWHLAKNLKGSNEKWNQCKLKIYMEIKEYDEKAAHMLIPYLIMETNSDIHQYARLSSKYSESIIYQCDCANKPYKKVVYDFKYIADCVEIAFENIACGLYSPIDKICATAIPLMLFYSCYGNVFSVEIHSLSETEIKNILSHIDKEININNIKDSKTMTYINHFCYPKSFKADSAPIVLRDITEFRKLMTRIKAILIINTFFNSIEHNSIYHKTLITYLTDTIKLITDTNLYDKLFLQMQLANMYLEQNNYILAEKIIEDCHLTSILLTDQLSKDKIEIQKTILLTKIKYVRFIDNERRRKTNEPDKILIGLRTIYDTAAKEIDDRQFKNYSHALNNFMIPSILPILKVSYLTLFGKYINSYEFGNDEDKSTIFDIYTSELIKMGEELSKFQQD